MPRSLRIDFPGAWHHVMHWSSAHRAVFPSSTHCQQFLQLLGEIHHEFSIEIHAYCLMDDGYQLLLRTPAANLSRAMRHLNGVYTQSYNRLQQTEGPLFRGRFKSIVVDGDRYLGPVTRYIHRQPVEAGLVQRPEDHSDSSYRGYIGKATSPAWLRTDDTLALFGNRSRQRYRSFVEAGLDEELRRFYAGRRLGPVLGSRDFCEHIGLACACDAAASTPDPANRVNRPDMESITVATAQFFGVDRHDLRSGQRGKRNLPRAVAMTLCHQAGGYPLREVAEAFGVDSLAAVSLAIYRLKARLREAPALARDIERLRQRL